MNATPRLLEVTEALTEGGLRFLILGGHAVRHYGIDRKTFDFDFCLSAADTQDLVRRLRRARLFADHPPSEAVSWRHGDFRRFQIGVLPDGKEEWLEFWFRNHLLAPFDQLYDRREEAVDSGCRLCFLSLPDLIRSKETERDDDWTDARHVAQHLTITEGGEPKQVRIVARPTCYFKLSRPVQNDGALSQHPDGLGRQF